MARRANVYAVYGRQGGKIGGASRMRAMSQAERSELAVQAARARWMRRLAAAPPAKVIRHMLDAIAKSGRTHMLFAEGQKLWHVDRDDPPNQKNIRSWLADEVDEAVPEHSKIRLVGTYGPGADLVAVMTDFMSLGAG